jgi:hypothetical protein
MPMEMRAPHYVLEFFDDDRLDVRQSTDFDALEYHNKNVSRCSNHSGGVR